MRGTLHEYNPEIESIQETKRTENVGEVLRKVAIRGYWTRMRVFRTAMLTLFLAVMYATAQPAASGSVSGTVRCEDTRGPARNAFVHLQKPINRNARFAAPQEPFSGTTDVNGAFPGSESRGGAASVCEACDRRGRR